MPANSVDMILTSPPYNVGVDYGGKGTAHDLKPLQDYKLFADLVMSEVSRVLKIGGRACVEVGGSGRNFPLSYIWQDAAYKAGLGLYSEISMQHRKTNQTAWGSWLKADAVSTIPNFHMLYVFYNQLERKVGGETTITSEEFVEWTKGCWHINWSADRIKEHPATFPVEFAERCLKLFGHKGDVVLDPFLGSGTSILGCLRTGRNGIGIEIEQQYYDLAVKRINDYQAQPRLPEVE